MRQGQSGKRSRGSSNRRPNNSPNRTIDSNGPEVKIRGTSSQLYEKYQSLAREANLAGERIASENYLQHAEHYYRLMNLAAAANVQAARSEPSSDREPRRDDRPQQQPQRNAPQPQRTASEEPQRTVPEPQRTAPEPRQESTGENGIAGIPAAVEIAGVVQPTGGEGKTETETAEPQRRRRTRVRRPSNGKASSGTAEAPGSVAAEPAVKKATTGAETAAREVKDGASAREET